MNSNFTFLKVKFTFFLIKKIFPEEKNEKVKKWNKTKKVKRNLFALKGAWMFNSKFTSQISLNTSVLRKLEIHNMTAFHLKCHFFCFQHFEFISILKLYNSQIFKYQWLKDLKQLLNYILKYSSIIFTKILWLHNKNLKTVLCKRTFMLYYCISSSSIWCVGKTFYLYS